MGYVKAREAAARKTLAENRKRMTSNAKTIDAAKHEVAAEAQRDEPPHVVIERTSKKLKKCVLAAYLLAIGGLVILCANSGLVETPEEHSFRISCGSALLWGGVVFWIVTKIRIWWNHG